MYPHKNGNWTSLIFVICEVSQPMISTGGTHGCTWWMRWWTLISRVALSVTDVSLSWVGLGHLNTTIIKNTKWQTFFTEEGDSCYGRGRASQREIKEYQVAGFNIISAISALLPLLLEHVLINFKPENQLYLPLVLCLCILYLSSIARFFIFRTTGAHLCVSLSGWCLHADSIDNNVRTPALGHHSTVKYCCFSTAKVPVAACERCCWSSHFFGVGYRFFLGWRGRRSCSLVEAQQQ